MEESTKNQKDLTPQESAKKLGQKSNLLVVLISSVLFLTTGFFGGYFFKSAIINSTKILTTTTLPVLNSTSDLTTPKDLWWNSIISTKIDNNRTWKNSNKDGFDVCGYTEQELRQMMNVDDFEKPANNAIVSWDSARWSPQCTRILFEIDTRSGKGPSPLSPLQGSWIYNVANKQRYKLPVFPLQKFINDDLILVDGYSDRSYLKGYDVFDIKTNRVIANIRPSAIRYRNPWFPWSFSYGIEWEYLPNESIISNTKVEKLVFKVDKELKVEFYRSIPQFDKSPYEIQKQPASLEGSKKGDYPITQYFIRKTQPDTDNIVDCEQWYTNDISKDTPAAIHFTNRGKEKDCQYDITTRIDNEWLNGWLNGNGFQFNYEFGE